jgi:Leucine-rich repeat (LRR) protein
MDSQPNLHESLTAPTEHIGYASNGGKQRYLIEAESTTGFVAWKMEDGTILVSNAAQVSLACSRFIHFWSCAGLKDTTHLGNIASLDCHGNELTQLDLRGLNSLKFLDCCFNNLAELSLDGTTELQALDVSHNLLTNLEVRHLPSLRILNCESNRLTRLDLTGMSGLQILDVSNNAIVSIKLDGCSSLRDYRHNEIAEDS